MSKPARLQVSLRFPRPILLACLLASPACQDGKSGPISYQGVVEFEERMLAFEVAGRIQTLGVRRGDTIAPNQPIAQLDASLESLAHAAHAAELATAQAELELVQAGARREDVRGTEAALAAAKETESRLAQDFGRIQRLQAEGAASTAEVDTLRSQAARAADDRQVVEQKLALLKSGARREERHIAEAKVRVVREALASSDERLRRHTLVAPYAGEVLDIALHAGELATPGAPVLVIGLTTDTHVDVFVPHRELASIHVGSPAKLKVDGHNAPFSGRVDYIARETEFTPRYIFSQRERANLVHRVRVHLDDPKQRLHAGVPCDVTFAPSSKAP